MHRSDYDSLGLDTIAMKMGFSGKTEDPTMSVDTRDDTCDLADMIFYNIYDSYLHRSILEGQFITEIENLAKMSRCPVSDSCRYITGTMVSTLLSTAALSSGHVLDWSSDGKQKLRIEGARVFDPVLGHHSDVYVFDFAAMYPTIMIGSNISVETVFDITDEYTSDIPSREFKRISKSITVRRGYRAGVVDWNKNCVFTCVDGRIACIKREPESLTSKVLNELIRLRKHFGKTSQQGWATKVLANSMYGANSAPTSGLFSYLAGSSVTLSGRWCITVVEAIAMLCGFKAIYGDTDSVFLSKVSLPHITIEHFERTLNLVLGCTPFGTVKLELENRVAHLVLIGKKLYYGKIVPRVPNPKGTNLPSIVDSKTSFDQLDHTKFKTLVKGVAIRRKDRTHILRKAMEVTFELISLLPKGKRLYDTLGEFYVGQRQMTISGKFKPLSAVKERRKGGATYYEFKNTSGNTVLVKPEDFDPKTHVPCRKDLIESVVKNCNSILRPCGMPTFEQLENRTLRMMSVQQ